jgi:hypothetical protein
MTCDKRSLVHAYHDGELSPRQREELALHLGECGDCRELLSDLRRMSQFITAAPLAEMPGSVTRRAEQAWWSSQQERGVLRISGWLTAAAAAVLFGAMWIGSPTQRGGSFAGGGGSELLPATNVASSWQWDAIMPPADAASEDGQPEVVQIAQLMANGLNERQ